MMTAVIWTASGVIVCSRLGLENRSGLKFEHSLRF